MDPEKQQETATATGRLGGVYFGWWTVLGTVIVSVWSWGIWGYGFGACFKLLQSEFGWTRAQLSAAYFLNKLMGGLMGVDVGNSEEFSLSGLHAPEGGWD